MTDPVMLEFRRAPTVLPWTIGLAFVARFLLSSLLSDGPAFAVLSLAVLLVWSMVGVVTFGSCGMGAAGARRLSDPLPTAVLTASYFWLKDSSVGLTSVPGTRSTGTTSAMDACGSIPGTMAKRY